MAGSKIPDSKIHSYYYVINFLAISFSLAPIRVWETTFDSILAVTTLYLREGQRFFFDQLVRSRG